MHTLIIEDEELTADRMAGLVTKHTNLQLVDCLHSVKSAVEWFKENETPDLIFLDIQLGDGSGFDILDQIDTYPYIVFTTAFDQYAIDAFKYNSIDYLLKPVKTEDLKKAIEKFEKLKPTEHPVEASVIDSLKAQLGKKFKQKFLVKTGLKYHSYPIDEIAYFYSEEGESYIRTSDGQKCIVDYTLDALEGMLDPALFFRINRHMLIRSEHITSIDSYFNNRLSIELEPAFHETIIVSRDRVKDFKHWLDQ